MKKKILREFFSQGRTEIPEGLRINHLFIYINTSCNLSCKYCNCSFLNSAIGSPVLEKKAFLSGLNSFIKSASQNPEFTFYGGEPMIYMGKLKLYVSLIREKFPFSRINVFTNGTLLSRETADFARKMNVNFLISIDGNKQTTDSARKHPYLKSVYGEIRDGLMKVRMFERMTANMVITADNVKYWSQNIKHLKKLGFESVNWDINYLDEWHEDSIKCFRLNLKKILLWHLKDLAAGSLFKLSNLYNYLQSPQKERAASITLLSDGKFYFCDLAALSAYAGNLSKDIKEFISNLGSYNLSTNELYCGIGLYTYLRLTGRESFFSVQSISIFRKIRHEQEMILKDFAAKIKAIPGLLSAYKSEKIR